MADSSARVTMEQLSSQQMVAEVQTQRVTREVADLTSPGGSRPMQRSYLYQPTPPAQWFGSERAERVHEQNAVERAVCDALFIDARNNKNKYAARRRDQARRAKNKADTGLARRVCESKAARTERGAKPRSRSRVSPRPASIVPIIEVCGLPDGACVRYAEECENGFVCAGLPVTVAEECNATE